VCDEKTVNLYYSDPGELESLLPLLSEFENRGWKAQVTKDLSEHSSLGIYAVGANHLWDFVNGGFKAPANDFSVIMLHDLAQDNGLGAEFFLPSEWSNFDLGLLPNHLWMDFYVTASKSHNWIGPRYGAHLSGYPKSDNSFTENVNINPKQILKTTSREFSEDKPNVLLATSWTSSQHIEEALNQIPLDSYNLLVKVPNFEKDFSNLIGSPWQEVITESRLESMRILETFAIDPRISLVEPGRDIFEVLKFTDVILSNGSNVILEGLIQGLPSISVKDWTHPSGPNGRELSEVVMNQDGCVDCMSSQILSSLNLALSEEFVNKTQTASFRLLPVSLRGRGAWLSANIIEHFYSEQINVVQVSYRDSALAERDSALAERDNALAERDNALAERDSALAERDNALAERDSILNSTIWRISTPYRKAKGLFRKN
jgi:hypothetical protein